MVIQAFDSLKSHTSLQNMFHAFILKKSQDRTAHHKFRPAHPGLFLLGVVSLTLAGSKHFPHALVLPVGMTMFVLMDGTINVIQTPLRALVADVSPPKHQGTGQLFCAMFQGLGGFVGYLLQRWLYTDPTEILMLYVCVFAINLLFVGFTCFIVKEEQYSGPKNATLLGPFIEMGKSLGKIDGRILRVMLVTWFSWWALFCWWPTSSTWFTEIVMGGCPDNPATNPESVCTPESYANYQKGLEMNANANIAANFVQLFYSLLLSLLMATVLTRVRFVWAFSLFVGAALLLLTKWGPKADWYAMTAAMGMSIPISAINRYICFPPPAYCTRRMCLY